MENTQTISKTPKLKLDFKDSKYATGRRKTSIAKVWLKKGSGKIYVNGKLFSDYFAEIWREKKSVLCSSQMTWETLAPLLAKVTPFSDRNSGIRNSFC